VRVAADHQVAGDHVALLRDELVAHAAPDVVDLRAGLLAEVAHDGVQFRDALERARRGVVDDERDLLRVEDLLDAHARERTDGERRSAVLAHHHVDARDHDVAGARVFSGVCREDLLGDGLPCYLDHLLDSGRPEGAQNAPRPGRWTFTGVRRGRARVVHSRMILPYEVRGGNGAASEHGRRAGCQQGAIS
jgi:hypothetical protein